MPKAIRTVAAEQDLRDIAHYIAVEDRRPQTAYNVIDDLLAKCNLLADNPLLGTAKPELGNHYRVFSHKRWVVIFRPTEDGIEVMRFVDGARDYSRLF